MKIPTTNLLLIFALLVVETACAPLHWTSYPGALKKDQCLPYAVAVTMDLQRRTVEAHLVEYDWVGKSGTSGAHAVCIFRREGALFLIDNESAKPFPLEPADDVFGLIEQYDSNVTSVRDDPQIDCSRVGVPDNSQVRSR